MESLLFKLIGNIGTVHLVDGIDPSYSAFDVHENTIYFARLIEKGSL